MADSAIACSECFENADGLCVLKDDDEQSANHREACHAGHQRKDNPYVNIK